MVPAVSESCGKCYTNIDSRVPHADIQIPLVWTRARGTVFFTQCRGCQGEKKRFLGTEPQEIVLGV